MQLPIYLDYAATTPVDPRVVDKMVPFLYQNYGNPASRSHEYGWEAERAVEEAREEVAALVGCDAKEIVWTSGATESINLAVKGAAQFNRERGRHLITTKTEHKATLDTMRELERHSFEVTYLEVKPDGLIDLDMLKAAIRPDTIVLSIMFVNNEIGVIQDVAAIGELCRERGIVFHVDSAQATGKLPIDLSTLKVDLMSFSAHKTYGPKGMGALYVRRAPEIVVQAQIHGGGQERGMRSGTLATHQIVGFGEACRICRDSLELEAARLLGLRERLWRQLAQLEGVQLNGDPTRRLPALLNVAFAGLDGETLMTALHDVAVSTGSACSSIKVESSPVLRAIGLPDALAHASLRMTVGRFTSDADIERAGNHIVEVVNRLREVESKLA